MSSGRLSGSANQVMIKIKGDDKDYQNTLKKSDAATKSFASKMKSYGPMIGAVFSAVASGVIVMSATMAAKHAQLERGFHSLVESQGRDAEEYMRTLKEMSHGTVSESEIMQKANQAMLLGLDTDTIARMMEGAAIIAQATGQDVGYMFESLALGVGRQSRMLLDNLGIIVRAEKANEDYAESLGKTVNALTDAERKTAFLNAAMNGLTERTDMLGGFTTDATTEMQKLKATSSGVAVSFGAEFLPALESVFGGINKITEATQKYNAASKLGEIVAAVPDTALLMGQQIRRIKDISQIREDGAESEQEVVDWLGLQSNLLISIDEKEFNRKTYILEGMGYSERALELENARAYGLSMQERSKLNLVNLEKEITGELKEQVSLEEKKLAYLAKHGATEGMRASGSGIDLSSMGTFGETRQSGDWTISPAASAISATKSGV